MRSSLGIGVARSSINRRRVFSSISGGFGDVRINYLFFEQFGVIGSDGDVNRATIQATIDYASLTGRPILATELSYLINVDSAGRGIELKSNVSIISLIGGATFDFRPPTNFKTSNFPGGTVAAEQVRAITIDNSVSPVNNISLTNITITTPLVKWYDASNYLQTIPIAFYLYNAGVEFSTPAGGNYNFTNVNIENFQRGSVSVNGRKIEDVTFTNCSWTGINMAVTQFPGENDFVHVETIVTGLDTSETSYDFNVSDGIGFNVALYNGSDLLYSIPYPTPAANPAIGAIVGNPQTSGLLQWTLGPGIEAQITSINVIAYRRTLGGTGAQGLNGVAFDFAPIDGLTLENCYFSGCSDQGGHYIYLTRRVNNILINNCTFEGMGINHWNNGGGIHIRGAAYDTVTLTNNTFINTHDNFHLSAVTNAHVYNNTHIWNYDLAPLGNNFELTYGAITGLYYYNNDATQSTNTFQPHGWITGYLPEQASDIHIYDNESNNIDNINTLGVDVLVEGNTLNSTFYATNNPSLLVMVHDDPSFVMGVTYQNNNIQFNGLNPQPAVEGFSGFTWTNNTINSINLFRFGSSLKLNDVTISGSIRLIQLNATGDINVSNFTGIISYPNSTAYLDMLQNQDVTMTNCTDTGTLPRSVASNEFVVVGTGHINMTAASAQNLAYIDMRVFTNTSTYQQQFTNVSAFSLTLKNYLDAFHTRNNLVTPGGVDFIVPSGGIFTLELDPINARLVKI